MNWERTTLGDVSQSIQTGPFGSQLHQSDYSETGTPVIMPKDLVNGKIATESIARVSDSHVERLSRHKVKPGDILYSRRGDVGRCAYATEAEANWLCGTGCLKVVIDPKKADPQFIFYQLQTAESVGWVEKHAIGATMLNLNTSILSAVPISLPPLSVQNHIAGILSTYDDLIEINRKQIELLEEAAQRLYKEWFIDFRFPGHETTHVIDGVPEGWERKQLGELCTIQKRAVTPEAIEPHTPYIGLEHIPRKDFCLSSWGDASEISSNKYVFNKDDIIFGQIRPYFHKVGFAIVNGVASTDSFVMRPQENTWGLFLLTVSSEAFVNYSYQTCKEGAKMPRADWNQMKTYPVLVAENDIQRRFEEIISGIVQKVAALARQSKLLAEARDRLLPKLMSGDIEV